MDLTHQNGASALDTAPQEEKQLFAENLLRRGEFSLLNGDLAKGVEIFDSAALLDPNNPMLLFRQGLALFEWGSEGNKPKALLMACKKFRAASAIHAQFFQNWAAWGNTLALLGTILRDHHYFCEAEEKYSKAIALANNQSSDVVAELFWDYGKAWVHIAKQSGEALDLQLALDAFQKASSVPEVLPAEFWLDYGKACLDLAIRINDVRLYVKAINCLKHGISTGLSQDEGWFVLAEAMEMLYWQTHDEDHFTQANECYAQATLLQPQGASVFLKWAQFLMGSARRNGDIKRLRACIEKCQCAARYDAKNAAIMAVWAEALALCGDLTERLDLIYEAQNKISEALELNSEHPDIWFSHGMCLNSFGHYFCDIDYYYQAIEKFQYGLSINRACHRLWHALANTYALVGQMEEDEESLERACRFFNKAIDLKLSSYLIFDYALTLSKLGELSSSREHLESSIQQFERALSLQKNALYLHPDWLFHYAVSLDLLGDFFEEESYYVRSIEIFSHVLMIDPDFEGIHHRMALAFSHLGELTGETEHFYRSIHHFRLASKKEEEDDQVIVDWGVVLVNLAERCQDPQEVDQLYRDAEAKLTVAAKLGNTSAYYYLAGVYSLTGHLEKAFHFIEKSQEFDALPPLDEILQDDWLDNLRAMVDFREFLSSLEKRPHFYEER